MKCRVCSQDTGGSARLCGNCDAAMKRAREVLTTNPSAPSDPQTETQAWWRRRNAMMIGAGVAVAVAAGVYLNRGDQNDPGSVATSAAATMQVATRSALPGASAPIQNAEPIVAQSDAFKNTRTATETTDAPGSTKATAPTTAKPAQKSAQTKNTPPAPATSAPVATATARTS